MNSLILDAVQHYAYFKLPLVKWIPRQLCSLVTEFHFFVIVVS